MATHSSILAWRISGTEEPGGLPSMGSHRVGHDWSDLAAAAAAYWEICPGGSDGKESSLGWEDPLKKGMETHPSILAWRFPWTEEPGGLQSIGWQRVEQYWATTTATTNLAPRSHYAIIILAEPCLFPGIGVVESKDQKKWKGFDKHQPLAF